MKIKNDISRLINNYNYIIERWKESLSFVNTEIQELLLDTRIETLEEVVQDLNELHDSIKDK